MVHLDFHRLPDEFARFIHYGHGRRNNEPFMQPLAELDLARTLRRKGFVDIRIEPFREAEGVDLVGAASWRFPWTVIHAVKPRAADRGRAGSTSRRTLGQSRAATDSPFANTRNRRGAG